MAANPEIAPMPDAASAKAPRHVAIIMDGNGRWAKARNLPRTAGHKAGAEAIRKVIGEAAKQNIKYLTIFAFSQENWNRPKEEVGFLMDLLLMQIKSQIKDLHKNNIRLKVIGDRSRLSPEITEEIGKAEKLTENNDGLFLLVGMSYGARQEILSAVEKSKGDPEVFEKSLYTAGIPDPDLLIRTSGEHRISNFLLWQLAYTELYFSDKLWPDFTPEDFNEALKDFAARERRFGNAT